MRSVAKSLLVLLIALGVYVPAVSQFDYRPFSGRPNGRLKEKMRSGSVGSLFRCWSNDGSYEGWATSTLKAEGKRPPKMKPVQSDDGESVSAYVAWTCMYSAFSAMDGTPQTAWVEGAAGDGIGEILVVQVDTRRPVKIWAGYGKSAETFARNNRPKGIQVYVLEGKHDLDRSTERGDMVRDIRVVAKRDVTLKDLNGYQPLSLPKHQTRDADAVTLVALETLSIYPGSQHRDTCISEVWN